MEMSGLQRWYLHSRWTRRYGGWRRQNGIRGLKIEKDPYNISEKRRLGILEWNIHISRRNILTNPEVNRSQISRIGLILKMETFNIRMRYDVSEFIGELPHDESHLPSSAGGSGGNGLNRKNQR
ncbi:hypothetical protein Tco_1172991 [Tanacetum coccineum]